MSMMKKQIKTKKKQNNKKNKWSWWNNLQIKIIWRSNKIDKKFKNLNDFYYYNVNDFGDKGLKFKIFKLELAHLSNETHIWSSIWSISK